MIFYVKARAHVNGTGGAGYDLGWLYAYDQMGHFFVWDAELWRRQQ